MVSSNGASTNEKKGQPMVRRLSVGAGPRCIYCKGAGPFSDEHVVCAGLGGDDNRFLLKEIVCTKCNTEVFSPLELEALRSSPLAIPRSFLQPSSRKRGKHTSAPKIHAQTKLMINKTGVHYEIDFGKHGKPIVLPQLTIVGGNDFQSAAESVEDLASFVESLTQLLGSPVLFCVRKCALAESLPYEVSTMTRVGSVYAQLTPAEKCAKPPTNAVWLEEPSKDQEVSFGTNIYRSLRGTTHLKLVGMTLEEALEFYLLATEQIILSNSVDDDVINPLVAVRMTMRIGVMERVIAKIGLNLLAYYLGPDFLRQSGFDSVKKSIVTGSPGLNLNSIEDLHLLVLLNCVPADQHCFYLSALTTTEDECTLFMICRLYGVWSFMCLGTGIASASRPLPFMVTADYRNHKMRLWSLSEIAELMCNCPDWMGSSPAPQV